MILGLNSDVRYKGKTFHIQTEDSGVSNPVLITHVFIGGNIIKTFKTEYQDALEREDLEDHVRGLMRAQHRSAYEQLLAGEFDELAKRGGRSKKLGDIPLAKNKGPVGLMSSPPAPSRPPTPSQPPTVEESAEITHDLQGEEEEEDEITVLGSMEVVLLDDEAEEVARSSVVQSEGNVEFPTPLLSKRPLPSLVVAYLVEDV